MWTYELHHLLRCWWQFCLNIKYWHHQSCCLEGTAAYFIRQHYFPLEVDKVQPSVKSGNGMAAFPLHRRTITRTHILICFQCWWNESEMMFQWNMLSSCWGFLQADVAVAMIHAGWQMFLHGSFLRFSICWVSWCSGLMRIHWQHEPNKAVQLVRLQVVQQFLGWMRTHQHLRTATQTTNHFEYASNMRVYKGTFKIELWKKHPTVQHCLRTILLAVWLSITHSLVHDYLRYQHVSAISPGFLPSLSPLNLSTMTTSSKLYGNGFKLSPETFRNGACMKAGACRVG